MPMLDSPPMCLMVLAQNRYSPVQRFHPTGRETYMHNTGRTFFIGGFLKALVICSICLLIMQPASHAHGTTIPPYVKDCVTFIFIPVLDESGKEKINAGTGFFVMVKDAETPNKANFYLVTAKHVIQDANKENYPTLFIRLNKRAGGTGTIPVPLKGEGAVPVYTHSDPNVDLAVIATMPDPKVYDYTAVPLEMMATADKVKKLKITEGDDVFLPDCSPTFMEKRKTIPSCDGEELR